MKKEQINIENRKYWNILKGIGILFIVMGHASSIFSRFVYLFHLLTGIPLIYVAKSNCAYAGIYKAAWSA